MEPGNDPSAAGGVDVESNRPDRGGESPSPQRTAARAGLMFCMLAVCALPAIFPGDIPYVSDEPNLIAAALRANAQHRPAVVGLYGSYGAPYGPLPTQFYQLLLLVTRDPAMLVALRAVLVTAVTGGALLWMARSLRMWAWFVPAVMLSPFLWYFNRLLWDNTFAIPVGALGVAAYASFMVTRSRRALLLAVACGAGLASIHFMTAPLIAVVAGHALWRHRRELWAVRGGLLVVGAVVAVSSVGYGMRGIKRYRIYRAEQLQVLAQAATRPATAPTTVQAALQAAKSSPFHSKPIDALRFPLMGGQLMSGDGFYIPWRGFGPTVMRAIETARVVSLAGYGWVWAGLGITLYRGVRERWKGEPLKPRDSLALILLVGVGLQMVMAGVLRLAPWVHYYNGTCIFYLVAAWIAVDAVRPYLLRGGITLVFALALGFLTLASLVQVHRDGGGRDYWGPTLANQVEVARAIARRPDPAVATDVPHYENYPHALWSLRLLLAPSADASAASGHEQNVIRYHSADPNDGRVEYAPAAGRDEGRALQLIPSDGPVGLDPFDPENAGREDAGR